MKRKIYFYGVLIDMIGEEVIEMDVDNISQMFSGLEQYNKDFKSYMSKEGIKIAIGTEDNPIAVTNEEMTHMDLGNVENIWVAPTISGEAPVVIGLAWYWQVAIVVGLILYSRISYKAAQQNEKEPQEQNASYLFNGGFNRNEEAIGLPIIYGEIRTGSVIISVGLESKDFPELTP